MPGYRDQVTEQVDQLIAEGAISSAMRDRYIELLAADDTTAQAFANRMLRGADYTHKTQALAAQRREQEAKLQQEREQLAAERAALQTWEQEVKTEITRLRGLEQQTPELMARVAAYETALKNYNLMDEVQVPTLSNGQVGAGYQPPAKTGDNMFNTGNGSGSGNVAGQQAGAGLTREEVSTFAQELLTLTGQAFAIAGEHHRLFGQPLTDDLVSEALQAGQTNLRSYWEQKYNVAGRRQQMESQEREKEIERIRAEERAKVMQELSMDPSRLMTGSGFGVQVPKSPLMSTYEASAALQDGAENRVAPEMRPDVALQASRVQKAAEYWNKHFDPQGNPLQTGGVVNLPA